jgi:uncharacterized protein DUF4398
VPRPSPRTPRIPLLATVLLLLAGCSEPPQKEIDQAQAAVDLARAAGAETYAAEEYAGATAGVQKARASVDQRDYRQALSYAIDARQRAQNALRQAQDAKTKAQRTADTAVTEVSKRLNVLRARLQAAEKARVPMKELRGPRAAAADGGKALQEARTEIGAGNYVKAGEMLTAVRKKLDAAMRDVENIPQPRNPRSPKPRVARRTRI